MDFLQCILSQTTMPSNSMPTFTRHLKGMRVDDFQDWALSSAAAGALSTYEDKKPKGKKRFISQREIHISFKKNKQSHERKATKALKNPTFLAAMKLKMAVRKAQNKHKKVVSQSRNRRRGAYDDSEDIMYFDDEDEDDMREEALRQDLEDRWF